MSLLFEKHGNWRTRMQICVQNLLEESFEENLQNIVHFGAFQPDLSS